MKKHLEWEGASWNEVEYGMYLGKTKNLTFERGEP